MSIKCENCNNNLEFYVTSSFDVVSSDILVTALKENDFSDLYIKSNNEPDTLHVLCNCSNPILPELIEEELLYYFDIKYEKNNTDIEANYNNVHNDLKL
ncbi:hypothetical protein DEFDS_P105 (plasmid) [Deferribacter desulfuricans SSM1]|uniref:Uncharacterized protein n=1 Tax=Deferribacter desulfuricans (strain DSM 14783 / JCM 11476 / NBRC 101012 / SSM1) TaxID=639282 RepID=D3PET6_DEFDS|nr:hypothetical protein [Deferribacter desulfuricans]BAI81728.1 hypothetical protein DEFDS_P105 [Deferribacter desulfuricans SSM1]